jgi:gluconate 2-dehydrogenase gamma chain
MSKKINRRKFMKITTVCVVTAGAAVASGRIMAIPPDMGLPDPYPVIPSKKPDIPERSSDVLFFNDNKYAMVATIASILIPTDEDPGATEAGVVDYIDRLVGKSRQLESLYEKGLTFIDKASKTKFNKEFLNLDIKEQISLLQLIEETGLMRRRPVNNFFERLDRKVDTLWDDYFGVGDGLFFFNAIRQHVFYGYYSNPVSWKVVGYFGPPQPVGYLDYADPPSGNNYTGLVRSIDNKTCQTCHFDQTMKTNHTKNTSCNSCHKPHTFIKEEVNGE